MHQNVVNYANSDLGKKDCHPLIPLILECPIILNDLFKCTMFQDLMTIIKCINLLGQQYFLMVISCFSVTIPRGCIEKIQIVE